MTGKFAPKIDTGPGATPSFNIPGGGTNPLATLFEGLGKSVAQAGVVVDQTIQKNILSDAQDVFADANKPFTDLDNAPKGVSDAKPGMVRLQAAYDQGKLSNTQYYARLVSSTKKLKTQYPGYSNEVDKIIQSVTGVRPANALRSAALAELKANASSETKKQATWNTWLLKPGTQKAMEGRFLDVHSNPELYSSDAKRAEVMSAVAEYNGRLGTFEMNARKYTDSENSWNQNKRLYAGEAGTWASYEVNQSIVGLNELVKEKYGTNISTTLNTAAGGKGINPAELQQLAAQINIRKESLSAKLFAQLSQNSKGKMAGEDIKKLVDNALTPMNDIISMITSGKVDVAGLMGRTTKAYEEMRLVELQKKFPATKLFKDLANISPEALKGYLISSGGARQMNELVKAVGTMSLTNMNYSKDTSLADNLKIITGTEKLNSSDKAGGVKNTLDLVTTQLGDPKGDHTFWRNVVDNVYKDDDIFKSIGKKSQLEAYGMLTNPKITKRIIDSGDKQLLNKYYNWSVRQMSRIGVIRSSAAEMSGKAAELTKDFIGISVDANNRLVAEVDTKKFEEWKTSLATSIKPIDTGIVGTTRESNLAVITHQRVVEMTKALETTLSNIANHNQMLSNIVPIMNANGRDPQKEILRVLQNNGVDISAVDDSWLQIAIDKISEATAKVEEGSSSHGGDRSSEISSRQDISRLLGAFAIQPTTTPTQRPESQISGVKTGVGNPLITKGGGTASTKTRSTAYAKMAQTLSGPFKKAQELFGEQLTINDAIAKKGTSRERNTPGSRHFHGDALDISTSGMDDSKKLKLIKALKDAGFTGFGFGNNIIHADTGPKRAWAYGNSKFGGKKVKDLISEYSP